MKLNNKQQILKESSAFPLVKFFNYKDWEVKLVTRKDDLKTEKDLYIVINNNYDEMERLGIRLPRIDQAIRKAKRYVDRLGFAPQPDSINSTRQDLIDRGLEVVSIYDLADDVDSALISKMERLGATVLLATPYSSRYWYFKDEQSMLRYFDNGGNIGFTNSEKLLEGLTPNQPLGDKIKWLRKKIWILQNNLDALNKDTIIKDKGYKGTLEQQLARYSKMLADIYNSQEYLNYVNQPDQLEEAKKKTSNILKQRAKKHRKHQKGLSPYSYLNPNAGDVQYNIDFFNRTMGSIDSSCDCADGGMGESLKLNEGTKGYGITTRTKWRKGNKKPERVEHNLDIARDLKDRLQRADKIAYIIFDLDTKKEIF